jgi:uncharacterized protein YndB with AHSA1/START domain
MITMNRAKITAEPGKQIMTVERIFDAPRDKVFAAMTQKDEVERWWTGPGYTNRIVHFDARDGGSWHFIQTNSNGDEFSFHGSYHMVSPEMTIQTFEFDGLGERGHVSLERMELMDAGNGKTKLLVTSTFLSSEDRDGMIQSGMEEGMQQTYAALDEVLEEMKSQVL